LPASKRHFGGGPVGGLRRNAFTSRHNTTQHYTTLHYTTLHYLRASVEHASSHDACLAPLAHPWYPAPRCPFQLSVEDVQRVLDCAPADDDNILLQGDASFYTVVRPLSWGL
jgi:hypothetical protein